MANGLGWWLEWMGFWELNDSITEDAGINPAVLNYNDLPLHRKYRNKNRDSDVALKFLALRRDSPFKYSEGILNLKRKLIAKVFPFRIYGVY